MNWERREKEYNETVKSGVSLQMSSSQFALVLSIRKTRMVLRKWYLIVFIWLYTLSLFLFAIHIQMSMERTKDRFDANWVVNSRSTHILFTSVEIRRVLQMIMMMMTMKLIWHLDRKHFVHNWWRRNLDENFHFEKFLKYSLMFH